MKIIDGMVLHEVAGEYLAVATGDARNVLEGVVKLNATGKDIWEGIEAGKSVEDITRFLVENYSDVTYEKAYEVTVKLIAQLTNEGLIVE